MIEKIDVKKCNGCGLCVEICPMDVIRLRTELNFISHSRKKTPDHKIKAFIAYPIDCMTCYTCELKCPKDAIQVGYPPLEKPNVIHFD